MINSKFDILVNPFTLNFKDKNLEKEFKESSIEKINNTLKIAVYIASLSSIIVWIVGVYGQYSISFTTDVILQGISILLGLLITKHKNFFQIYDMFSFVMLLFLPIHMLYSHYNTFNLFPILNTFSIVVFISLVLHINFIIQISASFFILLSVLLIPYFYSEITFEIALERMFILFSFFMLVSTALYVKQKYERIAFYRRKQLIEKNKILEADSIKLELQSAIGLILQESTQIDLYLHEFLDNTLAIILELSWLKVLNKGSVFLTNNDGNLEMVASKNLGVLTKTCALIKPGQCLCGKALEDKELLFNNCVSKDHSIRPEGMTPHGHYNVPLIIDDNVLGVLNIYVEHGHEKTDEEEYFFILVADTLSSVIYRHQLEKDKTKQAEIIKSSHQKIKSSIEYAQRIQQSLLSSSLTVKDKFKDIVLKYIPKEIVSGDFYFAKEKNDGIYLAVADCTGHGVPGALVSTLGIQELFHIIDSGIKDTGEILNALNNKINFLLNNDDEIGSDGMDIILLCVDQKNNLIHYSGAKGLFYMYQNNELIRYKTDNFSIGSKAEEVFKFNTKTIEYKDNDTVYLLTDGIIDQMSKVDNKRIGSKRVKQLMLNMSQVDVDNKQSLFDDFFKTHQSEFQIDDITFVTFKL